MIHGGHHHLGTDPAILEEVKFAVTYLKENDQIYHGTGTHHFQGFSIQF